jgi:uncharacterized membrane protein YfcA
MSHELLFMLPYFLLIGLAVGVLSMMFGIGGGLVIVPGVSLFLQYLGYSHSISMKVAVATSLLTIMFSTLNVLYRQNKLGNVPWALIAQFIPFVVLGSMLGVVVSSQLSGVVLSYIFVIALFGIIVHSFFKKGFKAAYSLTDFQQPSGVSRVSISFVVGALSILIGIGGNVLFVPYLRHYRFPMKNATAFTVGVMPLLALIGSIGYLFEGLHVHPALLPAYCLGYVNVPACLLIVAGSFAGAILGQKLLTHINDKVQAKAYLCFLVVIFILMLRSI